MDFLLKKRLFTTLLMVGFAFLISCDEKNKSLDPLSSDQNETKNVLSFKNILMFRNDKIFSEYIEKISSMKEGERLAFEKKYDFVSLPSHVSNLTKSSGDVDVNPLIEFNDGEARSIFYNDKMATILNKDGYVIIGRVLYQFSNEFVKSIKIEDFNKITDLFSVLRTVSKTDKSRNIFVSPVKAEILNSDLKTARHGLGTWGDSIDFWSGQRHIIIERLYKYQAQTPIYDFDDYDCDHPFRVYDPSMGLCWPILVGYGEPINGIVFSIESIVKINGVPNYQGMSTTFTPQSNFNVIINNVPTHVGGSFTNNHPTIYHSLGVAPQNAVVEVEGTINFSLTHSAFGTSGTISN